MEFSGVDLLVQHGSGAKLSDPTGNNNTVVNPQHAFQNDAMVAAAAVPPGLRNPAPAAAGALAVMDTSTADSFALTSGVSSPFTSPEQPGRKRAPGRKRSMTPSAGRVPGAAPPNAPEDAIRAVHRRIAPPEDLSDAAAQIKAIRAQQAADREYLYELRKAVEYLHGRGVACEGEVMKIRAHSEKTAARVGEADSKLQQTAMDMAIQVNRDIEASFSAPDHVRMGLNYGRMLDAINRGLRRGERDFGVNCRLRIDLVRNYGPEYGMEVLDWIEEKGDNIVAVDIGGSEKGYPLSPMVWYTNEPGRWGSAS